MRRMILLIIGLILLFVILMFSPTDDEVSKGLGILAFASFPWLTEALELFTTALMIPIIAVILNIFDVKTAFSSFSHPIIFLFLAGFVFAGAMSKYRIDKFIANKLLSLST